MPTMRLKQPVFTYPDCVPFIKNKERIQKLKKKPENTIYIYKNEPDKT